MLELPDALNLGEEADQQFYSTVQVNEDFQRFASVKPVFRGERIGYGITIPSNAPHPREAALFIAFLLEPAKVVRSCKQTVIPCSIRAIGDNFANIPAGLQSYCTPDGDTLNRKRLTFNLIFSIAGGLLVLFVVLPLVSTLLSTTPAAFLTSFGDPEVLKSIGLTFGAAAIATTLALVTGVPLAYLLARRKFRGKRLLEAIINLPVVIPHTAAGIALLLVFGRRGCSVNGFLRWGSRSRITWPGSWSPCSSSACHSWLI